MKPLISLIFIGAIIGLGIMIGRGAPTLPATTNTSPDTAQNLPDVQPTSSSASDPTAAAQGGSAPTGRVFALVQSGQDVEIQTIDVVSKAKKSIFSDKASDQKIKFASNVTANGDSVVLVLGDEMSPEGKLVAVKTDGSAKQSVLAQNFVATSAPVLSPDQSKIALVNFSNAEPNFGFTLVLQTIDGKDKKELAKDESGISQVAFSPDGQRIAFLKGAAATSSEIAVVTIATGKIDTLYAAKNRFVQAFDWSSTGLLAVTSLPTDKKNPTQIELFLVDPKTKESVQLTKNDKVERTPEIAPDASGIAFIEGGTDLSKASNVVVTLPDGKNPVTIGQANELLGWVR